MPTFHKRPRFRSRSTRFNNRHFLRCPIALKTSKRALTRVRDASLFSKAPPVSEAAHGNRGKGRNRRVDLKVVLRRIARKGANALLNRGEATALIASRTMDKHDDLRTARNRVGMQMDRSLKVSNDVTAGGLARRPDGRFTVDEIARWGNRRHSGVFADLPTKPRDSSVQISDGINVSDASSNEMMPGDVERLQQLVTLLRSENAQLIIEFARKQVEKNRMLQNNLRGKGNE